MIKKNIRENILAQLSGTRNEFDILVIGGGSSGMGAALEAASRGYKTLLLEQSDFSKGTSSRSTKLVHGGVRYLAQGNLSLVLEALRERGRLKRNAPHLVKDQSFVIPCYHWWCVPFYTIGLTIYDLLAGKRRINRSVPLSKRGTQKALPAIQKSKLRGGIRYFDCQFDDARLNLNLCQTLFEQGGLAINYVEVKGLTQKSKRVNGVLATDLETGIDFEIGAKSVINATGVFVDQIRKMEDPEAKEVVKPSQGIHLVMEKSFLKGGEALMIPRTPDGRVLFAVPWHNRVVLGTTDTEKQVAHLEPQAEEAEVNYLLEITRQYMIEPPGRKEVLSVFSGLRPLAAPASKRKKTKEISRGHKILQSKGGLITLIGGKWTTYRKMGEDVVDVAISRAGLPKKRSVTKNLKIHGYLEAPDFSDPLYWYGSDRTIINQMIRKDPEMGEVLSEKLHIYKAQVVWAAREEMARTLEDCLSRRIRALQLDAAESIRIAPRAAQIMAMELGYNKGWVERQVLEFNQLASRYLVN